ncbi:MAG TPA: helix-turn-helix domain-containing protein [Chroococcales cyanobacterium]|jgi:transcriptional regulator with XRE-family HTH domain
MSSLKDIGQELKEARLGRGVTLEEVARATHLSPRHLADLEEGLEENLPEAIYVKSFIRKYANFLGLPGNELAEIYWKERPSLQPAPPPAEYSYWWLFPILASLVLLLAVGIAWQNSGRKAGPPGALAKSSPISPSPSPATHSLVLPSPKPTLPPTAVPSVKSATPSTSSLAFPLATDSKKPVSLAIETTEACWVVVVADGKIVQKGNVPAGQKLRFTAERSLKLRLGNAGGAWITYDGDYLGALGGKGEVVERTFD